MRKEETSRPELPGGLLGASVARARSYSLVQRTATLSVPKTTQDSATASCESKIEGWLDHGRMDAIPSSPQLAVKASCYEGTFAASMLVLGWNS